MSSPFIFLWVHYCAAIAVLWIDFVREVRWCWDEGFRLPRVSVDRTPDLESCILHQKLQMVIFCSQQAPRWSSCLCPFVIMLRLLISSVLTRASSRSFMVHYESSTLGWVGSLGYWWETYFYYQLALCIEEKASQRDVAVNLHDGHAVQVSVF